MSIETIEAVYEALARAVEEVGEERAPIYLAEVCLTLANELDDADRATRIVQECIPRGPDGADS